MYGVRLKLFQLRVVTHALSKGKVTVFSIIFFELLMQLFATRHREEESLHFLGTWWVIMSNLGELTFLVG